MSSKKELKKAISEWREYTERERFYPAKLTGQNVVKSLSLELETDETHCVCHLGKLKDCPNQTQNKHGYH